MPSLRRGVEIGEVEGEHRVCLGAAHERTLLGKGDIARFVVGGEDAMRTCGLEIEHRDRVREVVDDPHFILGSCSDGDRLESNAHAALVKR